MSTWPNYIYIWFLLLGLEFSVDDTNMGFKVIQKDKKQITYKAEGDGFQEDALCREGLTHQVCMRNDTATSKDLSKGMSPINSRVMSLFDSVKYYHHQCAMENIYNYTYFCRAVYKYYKKVLCHGVTRKGGCGIHEPIKQVKVENDKEKMKVFGTVKAAVIEGSVGLPNLVACSIYDTKPVNYLSMVTEKLRLILKEKI